MPEPNFAGGLPHPQEHTTTEEFCVRFFERSIPDKGAREARLKDLMDCIAAAIKGFPEYQVYLALCCCKDTLLDAFKQRMDAQRQVEAISQKN